MQTPITEQEAAALLQDLYGAILGRAPDSDGLANFSEQLLSGKLLPRDVIDILINCEEFGRAYARRPITQRGFYNETSQYGEISVLLDRILAKACPTKTLVEVGVKSSEDGNSYDLLKWNRWRGILIEANSAICPQIRQEYQGLDFELVECAVSDFTGTAEFFMNQNDAVSSLQEQSTSLWGAVTKKVAVQVRRLSDILAEYAVHPDFEFLSIDVEGVDIKVLNDLIATSNYRPRHVLIEHHNAQSYKDVAGLEVNAEVKKEYQIVATTLANILLERRRY